MQLKEIKDIIDKAVENLLNGGLIPVADATNSLINLKESLRQALQEEALSTEEPTCHWCIGAGDCPSKGPFGFCCTRERGHDGDHVACGGSSHNMERWHNAELEILFKDELKRDSAEIFGE